MEEEGPYVERMGAQCQYLAVGGLLGPFEVQASNCNRGRNGMMGVDCPIHKRVDSSIGLHLHLLLLHHLPQEANLLPSYHHPSPP